METETINCAQVRYKEFPELCFGVSSKGVGYFDATNYILNKGDIRRHSVEDFKIKFAHWIKAVCNAYGLELIHIVITNHREHYLIDESLALIFISYIDPEFGVYMLERISEMLITGVTLSDTNIMVIAKERLSREQLTILLKDEERSL